MNNPAPTREPPGDSWTPGWVNWFAQIFGCLPWKKSYFVTAVYDFGNIAANSQAASSAVTVTGAMSARSVVHVTPSADTSGITYKARVTADNEVTIYAINFTAGAINPASLTFSILIFQN
jgi:hypothetical protein